MLQTLYMYVARVCSNFFIYFRRMLQLSYLDVAKVDLYVAYISMLPAYVSSVSGVSYICCKCFMWTLHMFAMATHVFLSFF
jgi:hypothetical protein